jgi:hypothetical protein
MQSLYIRSISIAAFLLFSTSISRATSTERSVQTSAIIEIQNLSTADLVLVDAGFDSGLRLGMVCNVLRSNITLGQLLLVDIRYRSSTALIIQLNSGRTLELGDKVTVKTISSKK